MKNSSIDSDYVVDKYCASDLSSQEKEQNMNQLDSYIQSHSEQEFENIILKKYFILRNELHKKYKKGCRIINILKICAAVLFLIFTVIAVAAGNIGGNKMLWLSVWILIIFILVGIFIIADYCKNLMSQKVLPFLDNAEIMTFGDRNDDCEEDEENEEDF